MRATTLRPHIQEERTRRPLVVSASAHVVLLAIATLGSTLCQPGLELEAGDSGTVGTGSIFPVALSGPLTGGAGNVAPSPTPAHQAARRNKTPRPAEAVEVPNFDDPNKDTRTESEDALAPPRAEYTTDPAPGTIPAEARPGIGEEAGGGVPGTGLRIGSGQGGTGVASWYVRQLEQRIARSWLRASLGGITERVVTRISFTISRGGQIENVQILESSGHSGIDRAAERAIRASSPLPPLPVELRARRVEFVAYFEYPPG